jgi:hypothetical protein
LLRLFRQSLDSSHFFHYVTDIAMPDVLPADSGLVTSFMTFPEPALECTA